MEIDYLFLFSNSAISHLALLLHTLSALIAQYDGVTVWDLYLDMGNTQWMLNVSQPLQGQEKNK